MQNLLKRTIKIDYKKLNNGVPQQPITAIVEDTVENMNQYEESADKVNMLDEGNSEVHEERYQEINHTQSATRSNSIPTTWKFTVGD